MKKSGRYDTCELLEDSYAPGSRKRVLKNKPGIVRKRVMDETEAREQLRALRQFLGLYEREHQFSASDICHMHKVWLGNIYEWAGKYRRVNISKGGFTFAMALQVPKLMQEFEECLLKTFTPCLYTLEEDIVHALAVVHAELILIHPFREGNGRLARILSVLMGLQTGLPPLDFGGIKGKVRQDYFTAIHAAMRNDYRPMEDIFRSVLRKTIQHGKIG